MAMITVAVMRMVAMLTVLGTFFLAALPVRGLLVMLAHSRFPDRSPVASLDADRPPFAVDDPIVSVLIWNATTFYDDIIFIAA